MGYIPIKIKFAIALIAALLWMGFSLMLSAAWIDGLAQLVGLFLATMIVWSIAIIPGFMNCFLVASLLLDKRPARKELTSYPPLTILVAAYNEENSILGTLTSIIENGYPGEIDILVIDDGSRDRTASIVEEFSRIHSNVSLIKLPHNRGKSHALNAGLQQAKADLIITIDADCYVFEKAIKHLVERLADDPEDTAAVAGAVHVRNSRANWVTAIQEWDYFHGIAAIKRMQSLFQGTLVAQGAFSIYHKAALFEMGGWAHTVGEDIVLTWAMLKKGYRIGYAEDAVLFTNAPETLWGFIRQRERWSRGMIEAFKKHWPLLFMPRMRTLFIWWNFMFPIMDVFYTFFFIPGLVAAFFGYFWIAGPLTLLVLPFAMIVNMVMFLLSRNMFTQQTLKVRHNLSGFFSYVFIYSLIVQPASLLGYFKEFFNLKKSWGTK